MSYKFTIDFQWILIDTPLAAMATREIEVYNGKLFEQAVKF
jgi:hypothetical protein